jgi:hypothetical protein
MSSKKLTKSKILKKLRNLKNVYDNKLIEILLKSRRENHVIKFQNNKKLSFMSFYNFSQNKLAILWQYLNNALVKD